VLIVVLCGCLVLSGIISSTLSAQCWIAHLSLPGAATRSARRSGRPSQTAPITRVGGSYCRYSSELQDDSSIEQQQRKCRERAASDGVPMSADLEFADAAISGTKLRRLGLDGLMAAARAGQVTDVYFESLSRLARESVITMPMLKDLVYNCRVRIVSVSEGIDSSLANWEMQASFLAWMHEQFLKTLRAAVLRGQEHAILNDWSSGDWCFGYGSEPIPGSEAGRRGRLPRPRMRVIINADHAAWVQQIFQWFVIDGWTIDRITRELTKRNAPKDHRATRPGWHHDYVRRVLRNEKYIGVWTWGRSTNMRNPLTGQVYQEGRPVEEVAKWTRLRPNLRIIEDEVFARAQVLLDANEAKWAAVQDEKGRFTGPRPVRAAARHLLQGLVQCGECGGNFQVCGAHGNYMGCARAKRGLCSCGTWLPRKLAEERLLRLIADHVYADSAWVDAVLAEAQACWQQQQRANPTEHDELVRAIQADEQVIRRLADAIELPGGDMEVLTQRLQERSRDKRDKERRLAILKAEVIEPGEPPTRAFVESEIRRLSEILPQGGADANTALGHLLNGGMVVREAQVEGRKRTFLIASVTLSVRGLPLARSATPVSSRAGETPFKSLEIALRDDPPWAQFAQRVKERFDAGLEYDRIATELQCPTHWVAKALAWWHTERGLPVPDGRTLKARLDRPTLAVALADQIKTLWDAGMPMQSIAAKVECSRDIVTAAIQYWFESRGLPVPDGRHRRRELNTRPQRSVELPMENPQGDPRHDPHSVADTNANMSSATEDPGTPMIP
jgi:site-specific DNA recombinase